MQVSKQNKEWRAYLNAVNALASLALADKGDHREEVFIWAKEAFDVLKDQEKDTAIAQLNFYLGSFYYILTDEIDLPLQYHENARKIWTAMKGVWNEHVADCYHGMGDIYKYKKSDFRQAEKCYERALQIRDKIKFKDPIVLFRNYYNLSTTNRSQRDFEKALSYGSKTLEIAKNMKDNLRLEVTNGVLASIYRDMGESVLAKKHYQIAISLNKDPKKLAWYYQGLGETLKNDLQYEEAIKNFLKAYAIYVEEDESRNLLVYLLQLMAETYSLKQDDNAFYESIHELFQEFRALGMVRSRQTSEGFLILGNHHTRKFNYDSALYYYQKALIASIHSFHASEPDNNPTEAMIGSEYYIYGILTKKASALKGKFLNTKKSIYWDQSLECLKLAEKLLSQERNMLDLEDAKWKFLEENYDLYEDILSLLYDGNTSLNKDTLLSLAFRYFEQSKSRSLADALIETERTSQISNQDSLFSLHATLKRNLLSAQYKLTVEEENKGSTENITRLREEIVTLDGKIQACKLSIEEKFPGYFNVKYGYRTPPLQSVKKLMEEEDQVLLEYFWGTKSVYGLGISDNEIIFRRVGSPDSIRRVVTTLLTHFGNEYSTTDKDVFKAFTSSTHQLYKILVYPFRGLIANKQRIQIIPDGSISQVPFEVLLEKTFNEEGVDYKSLPYMIKSHEIGYAYSAQMLMHKTGRLIRNPALLAMGFTGGQRLRAPDRRLTEIEGTERELDALEKRFDRGKFLSGNDATESNFKSLAPEYDLIHLAIHGKGDTLNKFTGSLYFRAGYDSLDDGELHAYELYGMKLRALMAVLSSCESGLGKDYKGEGMISMASAFTYSGCENILMSLWKVNDQASILLMDNFYGHLLKGETIDAALRSAKLNYLETADELTADPRIWAPLIAYGSLDQIFQKNENQTYLILSLSILVSLALFFIIRKKI